jgi:predicted type IV restriction endonuclease
MLRLNFPQYTFKFRNQGETIQIFCSSRKKWVKCTPEEWVRQHVLLFLNVECGFSMGHIRVEVSWPLAGYTLRSDVVIYDQNGVVIGLVECKAPHVKLDNQVSHQIMTYNQIAKPQWLIITNGFEHICWDVPLSTVVNHWPKKQV